MPHNRGYQQGIEHDSENGLNLTHVTYNLYCWLWSLIFQIQRYYSIVIVTQEYCTLIPPERDVCIGRETMTA